MTRVGSMILAVALVLVVAGCAPKAPTPSEVVNLEIHATGPTVAPPYQHALAISEMLKNKHPWLRASILTFTGAILALETADALPPERRKISLILSPTTVIYGMAKEGKEPYARGYTDLKIIGRLATTGWTFCSYDPIKTPQDLIGKKIGLIRPGSDPYYVGKALLEDAWGIWDEVEISHHEPVAFKDAMVTGLVDASLCITINEAPGGKWIAAAWSIPIVAARESYLMQITEEDINKINAAQPWETWLRKVPKDAGGKGFPPEDTNMMFWIANLACWDSADEEVVYELTKFLDENRDEWERRAMNPGGIETLVDIGPGFTEADVHPGALRYYTEKGYKLGA